MIDLKPNGRLREEWESYRRNVMPPDAGPSQKLETRRAFYAGAAAFFKLVYGVGEETVSEEQGVEMIESLSRELHRFVDGIKNGVN